MIANILRDLLPVSRNQYFEGTLQLRNPSEEIVRFVANNVKRHKNNHISRVVERKNGFDIYMGSQHELQSLGKKLLIRFGGIMKVSQKLHTYDHQKSRKLYRVSVLHKALPFSKGDIILIDGVIYIARKLGKTVNAKNLLSGKASSLKDNLDKAVVLVPEKATIIRVRPSLQILDPVSFQPVSVMMPDSQLSDRSLGEKISVVKDRERWVLAE